MTTLEEHVHEAYMREKARVKRKLYYALSLLFIVYLVAIGTFHYVENWTWIDSVYFTTSTITTVGYGDITPKTDMGKLINIPLMFIGIAVGLYVIYAIQDYGKANLGSVARGMGTHFDNVESSGNHIRRHVEGHIKRLSGKKK